MARRLRLHVPGGFYHVTLRGNHRQPIFFAETDSPDLEKIEKLYYRILDATFQVCGRLGAAISHHHGIGLSKAGYMTLEHDPVEMALMKKIKKTLDPNNIMNPGKRALDG